ncbi:MAG TPA: response regulator, partial [Anaerolineae bacterium]|nr:response regulator [Anaerolineae bacterium]
GEIEVESEVGRGSTFRVVLPVIEEVDYDKPKYLQGEDDVLSGKRVLIVDDNPINRKLVKLQANSWGMISYEVGSGQEALSVLQAGDDLFDVATIDFKMPEMDGLALGHKIHEQMGNKLPLLLLTSLNNRLKDERMKMFTTFLMKPIKSSQLYDVLVQIFAGDLADLYERQLSQEGPMYDEQTAERWPLRILLAEDNTTNQKLARLVLKRLGYEIDIVSNGLEAVQALETQSYDLILMDMQMPEMDGLEATQYIRDQLTDQPYIVAITANATKKGQAQCIRAGMDDYIRKPFKVKELVSALGKAFSYRYNQPVEPLVFEGSNYSQKEDIVSDVIIDEETINELKNMLGSQLEETLPILIEDFVQNGEKFEQELKSGLKGEDAEMVRRTAHKWHSSAIGFGALRLASLLSKIEAKGENGDFEGLAVLIEQTKESFTIVCERLIKMKEEI